MSPKKSKDPLADWFDEEHKEVVTAERGVGFARFTKVGQRVRGYLREWHVSKFGPYVLMELSEDPTVEIVTQVDGEVDPQPVEALKGSNIYVGVHTVDLARKVTRDMLGEEVGIAYAGELEVVDGKLKLFRVIVFQSELPF